MNTRHALLALALLAGPSLGQRRALTPHAGAFVEPAVVQELRAGGGRAYVSVELRPVAPGDLAQLPRQQQQVHDRQEALLAVLRDEEFTPVYRYRTFAGLTGWVSEPGLELLRRHPDVRSIRADLRAGHSLGSSGQAVGANLAHQVGVTGEGITVAVLDGGIDTDHPDLLDDIAPGAWHFLGQGSNVGPGAEDVGGHGTAVSGVITSAGIVAPKGIAPDACILPVQVASPSGIWLSDIAAGIDYVVSVAGDYDALVAMNISLGSTQLFSQCGCDAQTPLLAAAAAAAKAAGIAVVASSGNTGSCGSMSSPACLSSVIAVGAIYDADYGREPDTGNYAFAPCFDGATGPNRMTCFTDASPCLDLTAPGRHVQTTTLGGGSGDYSGTSFAAPQVVAFAALMNEASPRTPDQLLDLARSTGVGTLHPGCNAPVSLARIDAQGALCNLAPELSSPVARGLSKISATRGGFAGAIGDGDGFGTATATPGDLDGDGVEDLVVGAPSDDTGGTDRGAVWVLFLEPDGRVRAQTRIAHGSAGFLGSLADGDAFGSALAPLGDVDGDGLVELAVGAPGDDAGGPDRGALWILTLEVDGTVVAERKVVDGTAGLALADGDLFGTSAAVLPDLDASGVVELAVGATEDDGVGAGRGALWVLFLDGTVAVTGTSKISALQGGFAGPIADGDEFGRSVAALGDLSGDGSLEVAVGAFEDDEGGTDRGAVWILSLDASAQVVAQQKVSSLTGGLVGPLDDGDRFGAALAAAGDLDGDGTDDLLVGAVVDDDGGTDRGAVWILNLAPDGTVVGEQKLSSAWCLLHAELDDEDRLGRAITIRPANGRLKQDLVVGAFRDDDGGTDRGAVWLTNLRRKRVAYRPGGLATTAR